MSPRLTGEISGAELLAPASKSSPIAQLPRLANASPIGQEPATDQFLCQDFRKGYLLRMSRARSDARPECKLALDARAPIEISPGGYPVLMRVGLTTRRGPQCWTIRRPNKAEEHGRASRRWKSFRRRAASRARQFPDISAIPRAFGRRRGSVLKAP